MPSARLKPMLMSSVGLALAGGAADIFLETERKDFRMFSLGERERAVELYFTTPMTTAQVVEHLGYPTRPKCAAFRALPVICLLTDYTGVP